ncbi:MAG: DUF6084 family protein [Candidatus Binatia bacterium]
MQHPPRSPFGCRSITEAPKEQIQSILLHCQIRLEATRRRYIEREQDRLKDPFGPPEQWSRSLRSLLWTNATLIVRSFTGRLMVDLNIPCTFDFNVAATKYFAAQQQGEIPIGLLFSGTVFYRGENGLLQVTQISWEKEAAYSLPVKLWREMMELYYPNSAWICLRRDVFERLHGYKIRAAIPTWEALLESLLPEDGEAISPASQEARRP